MAQKKKQGRPKVDDPQKTGIYIKFTETRAKEIKAVAKSEGYTFSGWVKMIIAKEIKRIDRRKKKPDDGDGE